MRPNLKVTFKLDRLVCYEEADGWGSAEPYMWTVFYKIDGTTCVLNNSLMLEGSASVYATPGSHGNLGNTDVDAGETILIPEAIGWQDLILTPIPVPDFVKQAGTDDVSAFAGCIVVLMEEDNISDDGAEAGHRALNSAVQNALDGLIPTLGFTNQDISDEEIENMTSQIKSKVEEAIKKQQNFFENIWSWINADDTIGTVVWKFSGDSLLELNPIALQHRWPNEKEKSSDNGDWELFGNITTEEFPSCPADVLESIFTKQNSKSDATKSMEALYNFRNNEMQKYPGLNLWWKIAERNSNYLKQILSDQDSLNTAVSLFKEIPTILSASNRDKALSSQHYNGILKILNQIALSNTKDRHARKDLKRAIDALLFLKNKSLNEIFEILSKVKPSRYPSLKLLERNERKQR